MSKYHKTKNRIDKIKEYLNSIKNEIDEKKKNYIEIRARFRLIKKKNLCKKVIIKKGILKRIDELRGNYSEISDKLNDFFIINSIPEILNNTYGQHVDTINDVNRNIHSSVERKFEFEKKLYSRINYLSANSNLITNEKSKKRFIFSLILAFAAIVLAVSSFVYSSNSNKHSTLYFSSIKDSLSNQNLLILKNKSSLDSINNLIDSNFNTIKKSLNSIKKNIK